MSAVELVLASVAMGLGACVQSAVGFGSTLLAAPVLVLIDPGFVPGPVALVSLALNLLVIRRERGGYDNLIGYAVVGLVPGTLLAGVTVASLSNRGISIGTAAAVLAAVAVTALGTDLHPTPSTLVGAGVVSGFVGTVSGIGGPPLALVYQRASGPVVRSTLARFFFAGGLMTVAALVVINRIGVDAVGYAAALLPGTLNGFAGSAALARHLDRRTARPAVLALSVVAALAVLARELT
ncbi:sulfite exporter TauE/SafE family protein [soil metagenome]